MSVVQIFSQQSVKNLKDTFWDQSVTNVGTFLDEISPQIDDHLFPIIGANVIHYDEDIINQINNIDEENINNNYLISKMLYLGDNDNPGLYQQVKDQKKPLTHLQATDPRLWNALSLKYLNKYSKRRWSVSRNMRRILLFTCSHENFSRHSIARLYWSAKICKIDYPENDELLQILWYNEDFMGTIMELEWSGREQFLLWFLEFCNVEENREYLFRKKRYKILKKYMAADDKVYLFGNMDKEEAFALFGQNIEIMRRRE